MMMQVQSKRQRTSSILQSILLSITSTSTLILGRSDIKAVAQGEIDVARVVVLHLLEHHTVAVKCKVVYAAIEEVVA